MSLWENDIPLKQPHLFKTVQQSQLHQDPVGDRSQPSREFPKRLRPAYDGAVLPGALTRNIEAAEPSRGFPTPFGTNASKSRRFWWLGIGLDLGTRQLSGEKMALGEILKHRPFLRRGLEAERFSFFTGQRCTNQPLTDAGSICQQSDNIDVLGGPSPAPSILTPRLTSDAKVFTP